MKYSKNIVILNKDYINKYSRPYRYVLAYAKRESTTGMVELNIGTYENRSKSWWLLDRLIEIP